MGFQKTVNEFLIGMVFPEVRGQLATCLDDSLKTVLGEATQVSVQPCRRGSVIKTSISFLDTEGRRRSTAEVCHLS